MFRLTVDKVSGTALTDVIATGLVKSVIAEDGSNHMYTVTVEAYRLEQLEKLALALSRQHDPKKALIINDLKV